MITVCCERLGLKPGDRVLDIGCGTGRHACHVYRRPKVIVVGADLRRSDLVEAKRRLELHTAWGDHGGGVWALSVADIRRLPFPSERFDCVICSEVLEHVHKDRAAVEELVRVLAPGGRLAVSVPRFAPERICWFLWSGYFRSEGGHVRIYRKRNLIRLLRSCRLRLIAVGYAHALHSPYWWLKCFVGRTGIGGVLARGYQRFLEWEILHGSPWIRLVDRLLSPVLGKSLVLYLEKDSPGAGRP